MEPCYQVVIWCDLGGLLLHGCWFGLVMFYISVLASSFLFACSKRFGARVLGELGVYVYVVGGILFWYSRSNLIRLVRTRLFKVRIFCIWL
jgi:hypothetical protein